MRNNHWEERNTVSFSAAVWGSSTLIYLASIQVSACANLCDLPQDASLESGGQGTKQDFCDLSVILSTCSEKPRSGDQGAQTLQPTIWKTVQPPPLVPKQAPRVSSLSAGWDISVPVLESVPSNHSSNDQDSVSRSLPSCLTSSDDLASKTKSTYHSFRLSLPLNAV